MYVTFAPDTGDLAATAGFALTGGANGTVTNQEHVDFLAALEVQDFQTVGLLSADPTLKSLYTAFVKRLREQEGKKVQAVLSDYSAADYEGVISVKNGVVLTDGTVVDKVKAVAWVTGATAAAAVNESIDRCFYKPPAPKRIIVKVLIAYRDALYKGHHPDIVNRIHPLFLGY